jgi:hypothetical protein
MEKERVKEEASRKDAKTQRRATGFPLRLCAFAGDTNRNE